MNRSIKAVLIILIAIFGGGILFVNFSQAQATDNLVVQFETTPLFNEVNFLPGQGISRWVKVTNNSSQTQRIAAEAINESDPNRLGDVLNLEIKEGGTTRYNDALSKFFTAGEVFLSDLAGNGAQTQYDFIVSFYSGAQNPFQGKSLNFDMLFGFQGTEGGLLPGAGGGAGGPLPSGLTIPDESVRVTEINETSVTITWLTSYFATSQIIYAKDGEKHTLDLTDNSGTPPKYGYERTTPESDTNPKVTFHSVLITGLTANTKYYYRAVSHASLAVSREHNFTTLTHQGLSVPLDEEPAIVLSETPEKEPKKETAPLGMATTLAKEEITPKQGITPKEKGGPKNGVTPEQGAITEDETVSKPEEITKEEKAALPGKESTFLAAMGNILSFGTNKLWLSIAMGLLLLLLLIFVFVYLIKKTRRKENQ